MPIERGKTMAELRFPALMLLMAAIAALALLTPALSGL
jgi:hypothetical protein